MEKYEKINAKIGEGYKLLKSNQTVRGCDVFLDAWENIKAVMASEQLKDLPALEGKFSWDEFIMNFVQDLEETLHNAAQEDPQYFSKRICYCEELLERSGDEDQLLIENARRAIAESHYALGNQSECDRLFGMWLADDPSWGWGYIGWSDCYHFGAKNIEADNVRAEEIISQALAEKSVRDRTDVLERAIDIYALLGNNHKVAQLKEEVQVLDRHPTPPLRVIKVGRNAPCPCGSGKKYKKCCGK